jgi:hypothetical protein
MDDIPCNIVLVFASGRGRWGVCGIWELGVDRKREFSEKKTKIPRVKYEFFTTGYPTDLPNN